MSSAVTLTILFVLLSLIIYINFETYLLQVNKVHFSSSENGLKALHLSDVHIRYMRISRKRIQRVIEAEKPDIILLTGDYIGHSGDIPRFLRFLDGITGYCEIFACLGNHEIEAYPDHDDGLIDFIKSIEEKGVTVLRDQSAVVVKKSKRYKIIGLDGKRYVNINVDEIKKNAEDDSINIVLAHNPDVVLEIPENTVDYLFCGHFHGGQVWLPFNIEFFLLRKEKLCRMGVKRGLHEINGIKMYINRGLGCVAIPFRFLSIPEISIYVL